MTENYTRSTNEERELAILLLRSVKM